MTKRKQTPHPERRGSPGGLPIRIAATLILAAATALVGAADAHAQGGESAELLDRARSSRSKGDADAPVVVYEVADFQCPYCRQFAVSVLPRLDAEYIRTGRVRWVFINYPVPNHRRAWAAAEAAMCAGAVGDTFWALHEHLYANQNDWSGAADPRTLFLQYGREAGTPPGAMRACMERDELAPVLVQDLMLGSSAGIEGTPTFFVGDDTRVVGVKSVAEWREILDSALDAASR